jgi:allophanate hydrolase
MPSSTSKPAAGPDDSGNSASASTSDRGAPRARLGVASLTLPVLRAAYASGALTPAQLVDDLLAAGLLGAHDPAWITRVDEATLRARADELMRADRAHLPLYGVPFAVKDNIDVAGMQTTAACPAYSRMAMDHAGVVQRLLDAGAILLGKTNLDQFATGLVGTRSPYGAVPNAFDADYISGGSSSGSASVVARGWASFALGTDTAGSGRVPAGFNNLVGLKPTRGLVSTAGVLPACRTLDCVSIFALTCEDAAAVLAVAGGADDADPYSRAASAAPLAKLRRVGVPRVPQFFGDAQQHAVYEQALVQARALGLQLIELDFEPLHAVAQMLYDGPWVAERYAAIREFFDAHEAALEPSVRAIISRARDFSAADAFAAQYRLAALRREAVAMLREVDALLVPTSPTIYRIDAVQRDPIALNSRLGHYTNFVNLLDWCALALPAGFRADGLPAGITLVGAAWSEPVLLEFGARWQRACALPLGATGAVLPAADAGIVKRTGCVRIAVVGAHLSGMPLNAQLTERRAARVAETATAPTYRLFALADSVPPKPGLLRVASGGRAIAVEVWDMPAPHFGSFVEGVPPPLGIGSVQLADGEWVKGFICEPHALATARDITEFGGWRAYVTAPAAAPPVPSPAA